MEENKVEEIEKTRCNLVLYTDGSFIHPFGGSSVFGYLYNVDVTGKTLVGLPKEVEPTDLGFMSHELLIQDKKLYSQAVKVAPLYYLAGRKGSVNSPELVVNSAYAEALALTIVLDLLEKIKELPIVLNDILIKTDSQMLTYPISAVIKGEPIDKYAYYDIYKAFETAIKEHFGNGGTLRVFHVRGHTNCLGNEIVDRLANSARIEISKEMYKLPMHRDENASYHIDIYKEHPKRDTFWTKNNTPRLFTGNVIYYTTPNEAENRRIFYYAKYETTDDEVGEKAGSALMGMIITEEEFPGVDDVINKQTQHLKSKTDYSNSFPPTGVFNSLNIPALSSYLFNLFLRYSCDFLKYSNGSVVADLIQNEVVSKALRPGILGIQLVNNFRVWEDILESYIKFKSSEHEELLGPKDSKNNYTQNLPGSTPFEFIDVTSLFFEKDKKTILSFDKDLEKVNGSVKVHSKLYKKEVSIPCVQGTDIPQKRYFKRLEDSDDIKVILVLVKATEKLYNYAYIIDATKDKKLAVSMWLNRYSNLLFQ